MGAEQKTFGAEQKDAQLILKYKESRFYSFPVRRRSKQLILEARVFHVYIYIYIYIIV